MTFLIADLDFYVIITVLSFYANYATGFYGVPLAVAAGLFVACIYAGSVTVNVFFGAMDLLGLKQKFILSKCITFPLAFGKILDSLSFMNEDAYKLLFGCSAVFILMTLYFSFLTDYTGHVER